MSERSILEVLVQDESFQQWTLYGEQDGYWQEYLRKFPDRKPQVRKAQELIRALHERPTLITEEEIEAEVQALLWKTAQPRRLSWYQAPWLKVAASVVLLAVGGWQMFRLAPSPTPFAFNLQTSPDSVRQMNTRSVATVVVLPDGSRVRLAPRASLRYPAGLAGTKREVILEGKAFFEVQKNPARPFVVYARHITTIVLGTSFEVDASQIHKRITVSVRTGKVSVSSRDTAVLLVPNQRATYQTDHQKLLTTLVENPVLLTAPPVQFHDFTFINTPVSQVFTLLEKAYGVQISYDAEKVKNCRLTAPLGNESLFVKLDIICKTLGANYEQKGTTIQIHSQGCSW